MRVSAGLRHARHDDFREADRGRQLEVQLVRAGRQDDFLRHRAAAKGARAMFEGVSIMRIRDGRAVPAFISQALVNEDVTVFGDGTQTRSFCYISDLVDGIDVVIIAQRHRSAVAN